MRRLRLRRIACSAVASAIAVCLLAGPASAGAVCGTLHKDFEPGWHGLHCTFESGAEEEWTVPADVTRPKLTVRGADNATTRGGTIVAKLDLDAGDTLKLVMGDEGAASSVSLGPTTLLVAGGGDDTANYADPSAEVLESQAPGEPVTGNALAGSVLVEWYDARQPMEIVEPLPSVVVDVFASQRAVFPEAGQQAWTVPPGVSSAVFELFGGPGDSGGARGHLVADMEVTPGQTVSIRVGGPGEDTTASWGAFATAVAAGGDTERPNYLPSGAAWSEAFWEGGGPDSQAASGAAIVHFSPPLDGGGGGGDPPSGDAQPRRCVVPNLRRRTRAAARRALVRAGCSLGKVRRRDAAPRHRGRVVAQTPRPGMADRAGRPVAIFLGSR